MRNLRVYLLIMFVFIEDLNTENAKIDYNHMKIEISLKVTSPNAIRTEILKLIKEKNGYLISLDNYIMKIIFPKDKVLEEIILFLKQKGTIIYQSFSTIDYSQDILNLSTKIKVKEEYLQQLYQLIKEADLMQTLEMEKEISKNIEEIEALKGQYNYYIELSRTMEIQLRFLTLEQKNLPSNIYPLWVTRLGIINFWNSFYDK